MAKNDLLKEAIADAKTVRNTALANAKAALEEAFTPKLKSMLSAKLTEELEEELDEAPQGFYEEDENVEEDMYEAKDEEAGEEANEEVVDEEISLEEILAELELEEGGVTEETGEEDEVSEAPKEEEELDEEINLNELLNEIEEDQEIDLNELLAELSEDDISEGDEIKDDEIEAVDVKLEEDYSLNEEDESDFDEAVRKAGGKGGTDYDVTKLPGYSKAKEEWTRNKGKGKLTLVKTSKGKVGVRYFPKLSLFQKIAAGTKAGAGMGSKNPQGGGFTGENTLSNKELAEMKAELNEAYKVIEYQKGKLNEVNVLNSKLLYVNKLFKAYNLNENQKVKVVDSLDQADNVKEAQIIYNTLNETFSSVKSQLKESIKPKSFASKATGLIKENKTKKAQPVNETVARFKKLANIN